MKSWGLLCGLAACAQTTPSPLVEARDAGVPKEAAPPWLEPSAFDPTNQIPALRKVYAADRRTLQRVDVDFNTDGRVDFVQHYDPSGTWIERESADLDGDGRIDVTYVYERSGPKKSPRLVRQEFDAFYKGRTSVWKYYGPDGQLTKRALDRNQDGREDYWEHYRNFRMLRSERDDNGDGIPDSRPQFRFRSLGTR